MQFSCMAFPDLHIEGYQLYKVYTDVVNCQLFRTLKLDCNEGFFFWLVIILRRFAVMRQSKWIRGASVVGIGGGYPGRSLLLKWG